MRWFSILAVASMFAVGVASTVGCAAEEEGKSKKNDLSDDDDKSSKKKKAADDDEEEVAETPTPVKAAPAPPAPVPTTPVYDAGTPPPPPPIDYCRAVINSGCCDYLPTSIERSACVGATFINNQNVCKGDYLYCQARGL